MGSNTNASDVFAEDCFESRHIGPNGQEVAEMLSALGFDSLEAFISSAVPEQIRFQEEFKLSDFQEAASESSVLERLSKIAKQNKTVRSLIGAGYYGTLTPAVIQRNILENPGWYTQYTPYQPEISQGRLEALLNYQTLIAELTGLPIANSSLLDEGTAAAEAMSMSYGIHSKKSRGLADVFFVASDCHPQTIAILKTRAEAVGLNLEIADVASFAPSEKMFGALFQYPNTTGEIRDYSELIKNAKDAGLLVTLAADPLALVMLESPGKLGADIAVGSTQRFGVPLGFGGPHAAYFATSDAYKRVIPGRLVGVSKDAAGRPALRLALQTREQHIRREKATSNICTAQVLLAVMAGMYGVYHGPKGLKRIAGRVNGFARSFAGAIKEAGLQIATENIFDTVQVIVEKGVQADILKRAEEANFNLRVLPDSLCVSFDEQTTDAELSKLVEVFTSKSYNVVRSSQELASQFLRSDSILEQEVFHLYQSETEFLRYVRRLESRDLSLGVSMIPLGSCTMKLNATTEMLPVTWPEFGAIHPFAPKSQTEGYRQLFAELERGLAEMTAFDAVSLQPNAGSQGEYAGLLAIAAYHRSQGSESRSICLIPKSAHGTNPASAVMAGMKVVVVDCDDDGNIDIADLKAKAEAHASELSCLMVTYPSTHGVFEEGIKEICEVIHSNGGQVYMDGANLNALVGLSRPAELGADVCHINLHKTFCIPHGGGGPGMGPIGVKSHLTPFLPGHSEVELEGKRQDGVVSAAPWGSASILPISWTYLALMGASGLKRATEVAILSANYIARKLEPHYPVLYKGGTGLVAHECILDLRGLKRSAGVEVEDVAKRLMDYGFHAPTISWPVIGTMMIEPTESESLAELDRFCEALIAIRAEITEIESGKVKLEESPLRNAPHTALDITGEWERSYSREQAAYPVARLKDYKFWPAVSRIDSGYGDRNLVCTCPDVSDYE